MNEWNGVWKNGITENNSARSSLVLSSLSYSHVILFNALSINFINKIQHTLIIYFLFSLHLRLTKIIKGIVKDQHSDERIPFASLHFMKAGSGKLADSSGSLRFPIR